jgi:hypothetical protein
MVSAAGDVGWTLEKAVLVDDIWVVETKGAMA